MKNILTLVLVLSMFVTAVFGDSASIDPPVLEGNDTSFFVGEPIRFTVTETTGRFVILTDDEAFSSTTTDFEYWHIQRTSPYTEAGEYQVIVRAVYHEDESIVFDIPVVIHVREEILSAPPSPVWNTGDIVASVFFSFEVRDANQREIPNLEVLSGFDASGGAEAFYQPKSGRWRISGFFLTEGTHSISLRATNSVGYTDFTIDIPVSKFVFPEFELGSPLVIPESGQILLVDINNVNRDDYMISIEMPGGNVSARRIYNNEGFVGHELSISADTPGDYTLVITVKQYMPGTEKRIYTLPVTVVWDLYLRPSSKYVATGKPFRIYLDDLFGRSADEYSVNGADSKGITDIGKDNSGWYVEGVFPTSTNWWVNLDVSYLGQTRTRGFQVESLKPDELKLDWDRNAVFTENDYFVMRLNEVNENDSDTFNVNIEGAPEGVTLSRDEDGWFIQGIINTPRFHSFTITASNEFSTVSQELTLMIDPRLIFNMDRRGLVFNWYSSPLGWLYTSTFPYYNQEGSELTGYFQDWGWLYILPALNDPSNAGGSDMWVWFYNHGWAWTSTEAWPWIYDNQTGDWAYLWSTENWIWALHPSEEPYGWAPAN